MNFKTPLVYVLHWIVVLCLTSVAFPGDDDVDSKRKQITATQISGQSVHLDGFLDDAVWQNARFVSDFFQKEPNEGEPATYKTEVAIAYDEQALYVGARMHFDNPDEIRAFVTRRDNAGSSERIIVSLDTYLDHRTAYSFAVTAAGVRVDYYHPSDREFDRDYSFNPVWEAKTAILDDGWSAEMKIPFSQLRFDDREEQKWGINFNRWIPNNNEDIYWVQIPKDETGWASRFGSLTGITGMKPSRRIELLPYSASSAQFTSNVPANDPFRDGSQYETRVGMDFKMGLGPNLTLDATVNPDFGQVEADPAVVNLTAFETFFDEKRPFFVEGNQLFENIGPTFFYSRRIGERPHGRPDGDFIDAPDNTTIISAAKVTGRLSSGLSLGVLSAVTAREHADVFISATDSTESITRQREVEPLTGYGVARLQQEFGASGSTVGLMMTGVRRDVDKGSELASLLNRQAYTGNLDWNLRFEGGKYELNGFTGFSHISGDSTALIRAQRSSARYYQRPDADYVTLDSSRTSLTGYAGGLEFSKNGGEHWLWGTGVSVESPAFELNDAGILFSSDGISGWGNLTYRETRPGKLFRDYSLQFINSNEWNFGGVRTFSIFDLFFNFTFHNFWRASLHYHYRPQSQSHTLTRGGPLMATPADHHFRAQLNNNFASNVNWSAAISYITDEFDGWDFDTEAELTFKPGDQWQFSINPRYSRVRNPRQYVTTRDDGTAATFGNRYIFSFIDRSTLSAQLRLKYAITPDLSLEVYAEPFTSSGDWFRFGELPQPRSSDLRFYGTDGTTITEEPDGSQTVTDGEDTFTIDNRDFNIRSFRSNFVLRWEWRPGSTLFVVWQQDRSGRDAVGDYVTPRSLFDSITEDGNDFFALKFSYWLPVD